MLWFGQRQCVSRHMAVCFQSSLGEKSEGLFWLRANFRASGPWIFLFSHAGTQHFPLKREGSNVQHWFNTFFLVNDVYILVTVPHIFWLPIHVWRRFHGQHRNLFQICIFDEKCIVEAMVKKRTIDLPLLLMPRNSFESDPAITSWMEAGWLVIARVVRSDRQRCWHWKHAHASLRGSMARNNYEWR